MQVDLDSDEDIQDLRDETRIYTKPKHNKNFKRSQLESVEFFSPNFDEST